MKTEQIVTMLKLQDRINSAVNPQWRGAGNGWSLAVMIECAELIDHIGWKWWKKQEMNLPQAQIEVVDIWHFVLSRELEKYDTVNYEVLATFIACEAEDAAHYTLKAPSTVIIDVARKVSRSAAEGEISLGRIFRLARNVGLTYDDLFRMYVGKAALNLFRQEHGYKDGTYIKHWFGHEDNVYLECLLARGMTDLEEILDALEHRYADVKVAAGEVPQ